jgi:hypothetical protein
MQPRQRHDQPRIGLKRRPKRREQVGIEPPFVNLLFEKLKLVNGQKEAVSVAYVTQLDQEAVERQIRTLVLREELSLSRLDEQPFPKSCLAGRIEELQRQRMQQLCRRANPTNALQVEVDQHRSLGQRETVQVL